MKKLEPGMRGRLIGYSEGGVKVDGLKAFILNIDEHGGLYVMTDCDMSVDVCPSQFRPFKVKAPLRECWVNIYKDRLGDAYLSKEMADGERTHGRTECVLFQEVRVKK